MPSPRDFVGGRLKNAYRLQQSHAAERGIAWEFSFEEWLAVWRSSGKLKLRGKGAGLYVMSRPGDKGPYSPENVVIKLGGDNTLEAYQTAPYLDRENCIGRPGTGIAGGRGYSFKPGGGNKPWRATFRGKFLGYFGTKEEARAAYVMAASNYLNQQGKPIPATLV